MAGKSQTYFKENRRRDAEYSSFFRLLSLNRQSQHCFQTFVDTKMSPHLSAFDAYNSKESNLRKELLLLGDRFSFFVDETHEHKEVNADIKSHSALPKSRCPIDDEITIYSVGESHYALLPDHKLRRYWDSFIFVLLLYVSFVSVFVYSFYGVLGMDSLWFWIERILDVAFSIDIVVSFFAAYEKNGVWVRDLPRIRRHYLKQWFILDVIATFPWDVIALAIDIDKSTPHLLQLPRFIRLIRFFKLFRLIKIFELEQMFTWIEIKFRLKYVYRRLAGLFITVIFLTHLIACIFYFFGDISNRIENESWTTSGVPEDLYGKYIAALYFSVYTITTIGYGDVVPNSTLERTYTTIIMFLGASCFAYVISQVSNICSELNVSSVRNRVLMDSVIDLQRYHNLPDQLIFEIRRFLKRENLRHRVILESELLNAISKDLRVRVLKHIFGTQLERSRLFRGIPNGHRDEFYLHAKEIFARKGQTLFMKGELADCFYVIIMGSVILTEYSKNPIMLGEGYSFGESDVLFNRSRKKDAICTTYSRLLKIPRFAVAEALKKFPNVLQKCIHEEALILWEKSIWHVEQQIRYYQMARRLSELGLQHLLKRKADNVSAPRIQTEKLSLIEGNSAIPDTTLAPLHLKKDVLRGTGNPMEGFERLLDEKKRRIAELEQRMKELQEHLNGIVSDLQRF